jgi:hypothetical protein
MEIVLAALVAAAVAVAGALLMQRPVAYTQLTLPTTPYV